jgi:quercetin dioxygenase-like cupin family protein
METTSLEALARQQVEAAAGAGGGHAAATVHGGRDHALRQTLIGMVAGANLAEHESPGEATLQVLSGRVRLVSHDDSSEAGAGELLVIPDTRHSVEALEDSALLLTVAKLDPRSAYGNAP